MSRQAVGRIRFAVRAVLAAAPRSSPMWGIAPQSGHDEVTGAKLSRMLRTAMVGVGRVRERELRRASGLKRAERREVLKVRLFRLQAQRSPRARW